MHHREWIRVHEWAGRRESERARERFLQGASHWLSSGWLPWVTLTSAAAAGVRSSARTQQESSLDSWVGKPLRPALFAASGDFWPAAGAARPPFGPRHQESFSHFLPLRQQLSSLSLSLWQSDSPPPLLLAYTESVCLVWWGADRYLGSALGYERGRELNEASIHARRRRHARSLAAPLASSAACSLGYLPCTRTQWGRFIKPRCTSAARCVYPRACLHAQFSPHFGLRIARKVPFLAAAARATLLSQCVVLPIQLSSKIKSTTAFQKLWTRCIFISV